ncbi:LysM domain/BON superfamily protein [Anoxybacillus sp. BCO1]|nr:LysM domain/BON superfamily protein [Anoxybacillus sp. BCO1]
MESIDKQQESDELHLPPRSEVHKKKKTKMENKNTHSFAFLRSFFVLLPISIYSIYHLVDKRPIQVVTIDDESYETIDVDQQKEEMPQQKPLENEAKQEEDGSDETEPSFIYHTVQENETLYSIAMKYYGNEKGMDLIKEWNRLTSTKLQKGQVLKIPNMNGK